jgi:uncharacterized RDD family membrane protein YckC
MSEDTEYIGLITRAIAIAIDAAVINLVALLVSIAASLILSLFRISSTAKDVLIVIGAVAYVLWTIAYFVGFWSTTGETPGDRVMLIRVVSSSGERVKPRWALVRCAGAVLSALPLFAGYLMILFTRRRRGLLDVLARTVVIESPTRSRAAMWRERLKQERSSDSGDEAGAAVSQA